MDPMEPMDEVQAGEALESLFTEPEKKERPRGADGKFLPKEGEAEPEAEPEKVEEPEKAEVEEPEEPLTKEEKRLLRLKIDGIEQDLPEDEVKNGYLRQSDYTKKTQALAEERKRFEAEERAAVRQERQVYAENLERVKAALEALTPAEEPDWTAVAGQMTPEEFTKHYASWKANKERLSRVEEEQARVMALQEQESERARAIRLNDEKERLELAIPDLKDPERGKVLRQDLVEYAKSVGFTDDDLALVEDHRPLVLLHKARLWDESQKRRPALEEKVDRELSALKPTGTKPAPKAKAVDALKNRMATSGSVEDAAKLIDALGAF